MAIEKIQPTMLQQHFAPIKSIGGAKTEAFKPIEKGMNSLNPFAPQQKAETGMGVGLVNSALNDMTYTLPNGKASICNTIGVA